MKFRKKPVVIDAVQFTSPKAVKDFQKSLGGITTVAVMDGNKYAWFEIKTLEGTMRLEPMDWLIRGVKGEYYPCKPDIFEATYEKA